jgi:hypothetical protein
MDGQTVHIWVEDELKFESKWESPSDIPDGSLRLAVTTYGSGRFEVLADQEDAIRRLWEPVRSSTSIQPGRIRSAFDRRLADFVPVAKLLEPGLALPPEEWWDENFPTWKKEAEGANGDDVTSRCEVRASSAQSSMTNSLASNPSYWTSSGSTGEHWLELQLPPGRTLARLELKAGRYGSFSPKYVRIAVKARGDDDFQATGPQSSPLPNTDETVPLVLPVCEGPIVAVKMWVVANHDGGCNTKIGGLQVTAEPVAVTKPEEICDWEGAFADTWTLEMDGALIAYATERAAVKGLRNASSMRLEDLLDDEPDAAAAAGGGDEEQVEEGVPPAGASTPDKNALRREVSMAPRFTKADVAVVTASPRGEVQPKQSLSDNSNAAIRGRFILLKAWNQALEPALTLVDLTMFSQEDHVAHRLCVSKGRLLPVAKEKIVATALELTKGQSSVPAVKMNVRMPVPHLYSFCALCHYCGPSTNLRTGHVHRCRYRARNQGSVCLKTSTARFIPSTSSRHTAVRAARRNCGKSRW